MFRVPDGLRAGRTLPVGSTSSARTPLSAPTPRNGPGRALPLTTTAFPSPEKSPTLTRRAASASLSSACSRAVPFVGHHPRPKTRESRHCTLLARRWTRAKLAYGRVRAQPSGGAHLLKPVGMGGSWVVYSRSMSTRVIAVAAAPPAAPPYSMSFALALESSRGWSASPSDRGPRSRQASAAATGHAELTQSHNALEDSHTGSAGGVCEAYRARRPAAACPDFSLCCLLSRLPAARSWTSKKIRPPQSARVWFHYLVRP